MSLSHTCSSCIKCWQDGAGAVGERGGLGALCVFTLKKCFCNGGKRPTVFSVEENAAERGGAAAFSLILLCSQWR